MEIILRLQKAFLRDRYVVIFLLFNVLNSPFCFAQYPCGTEVSDVQFKNLIEFYTEGNQKTSLPEDTFFVPVKVHIIRNQDGTGGLSIQKFRVEFDSVNFFYQNAKIQFFQCGQIQYIDNSEFLTFNAPGEEDLLTGGFETPRVINIYFADTILLNGKRICGYSYLPMGANNIFIDNACVNNGNTVAHELGHYFSLLHTHGKSNTTLTVELVNGSNCSSAGDYICDTPADPNLEGKVSYNAILKKCFYTGSGKDANGDFFAPMVENIMSYSKSQCTNKFTPGQYNRIRNSLFYHGRVDLACTSEIDFVEENLIGSVNPNPFSNYFFVSYQLASESKVLLAMYDVFGNKISVLHEKTEPKGLLKLYYPWGDTFLNSGIYFLKMEVNDKVVSVKKIVRINN